MMIQTVTSEEVRSKIMNELRSPLRLPKKLLTKFRLPKFVLVGWQGLTNEFSQGDAKG